VDPKPESEVQTSRVSTDRPYADRATDEFTKSGTNEVSGETIIDPATYEYAKELSSLTERILSKTNSIPTDREITTRRKSGNSDDECLRLVKKLSRDMECVKQRLDVIEKQQSH